MLSQLGALASRRKPTEIDLRSLAQFIERKSIEQRLRIHAMQLFDGMCVIQVPGKGFKLVWKPRFARGRRGL